MKSFLLSFSILCLSIIVYAQPSITPAAGFEWVMTGSSMYTDNGVTASSTFGAAGDTDPVDCSALCGGNCDGDGLLEKLVFGGTSLPASSCEQRAVNLVHWINGNPESAIADGATSGTVHLATAAQVEIVGTGTSISGADNKGFIIGGNGPGNFSEFNTQVDYSLNWQVDDYSLTGGTGPQVQQFTWNWGEPGGGAEVEMSGWNDYSTAAFSTSGSEVLTVPTSSIIETGGNMEVVFDGNMEMSLSRNYGNADGKVQTVPSIEGEAIYRVNYDIWEIQAVLPVELISFSAKQVNSNIKLQWITATEINNERFLIERSMDDSQNWQVIGSVLSKGDSQRLTYYSYTDEGIKEDIVYYRLTQVDKDGTESTSASIAIENSDNKREYTLYPNPANNSISAVNMGDNKTGVVINQNGEIVKRVYSREYIDISDLPAGIYSFSILFENGSVEWTDRFIKL